MNIKQREQTRTNTNQMLELGRMTYRDARHLKNDQLLGGEGACWQASFYGASSPTYIQLLPAKKTEKPDGPHLCITSLK